MVVRDLGKNLIVCLVTRAPCSTDRIGYDNSVKDGGNARAEGPGSPELTHHECDVSVPSLQMTTYHELGGEGVGSSQLCSR